MKKTTKLIMLVYVILAVVLLCSCSEDNEPAPETDCYEIAKQLEREQFEARQNGASLGKVQNIRLEYIRLYPECAWN